MANALLSYTGALGYVTELLSGDYNAPFGRSSHHQIWSEAMVITPAVRGMLGIEIDAGGKELRFAPQLPANWDQVEATNVIAGDAHYDLKMVRAAGRLAITTTLKRPATTSSSTLSHRVERLMLAPAFPLDAQVHKVTVQGRATQFEMRRIGDVQRAEIRIETDAPTIETVFTFDEGTDIYFTPESLMPGAQNSGLRIVRARADSEALHLVLEGLGGHTYAMRVRSPFQLGEADGLKVQADGNSDPQLTVAFEGPSDTYVRRELSVPIRRGAPGQPKRK
jgi:hypothetical protein